MESVSSGLSKPTRRGIQKCSCGQVNGTKAYFCKGCRKALKAKVTKDKAAKTVSVSAAVKLVGLDFDQIFSVQADGSTLISRSFVQIFSSEVEGNWGLCYAASCPTNNLVADDRDGAPCLHIQYALDCSESATPMDLVESLYDSLNTPDSLQQDLLEIASVPEGVVQKINENYFVVKCPSKTEIPLGFVHCYLNNAKLKVFCDCFLLSRRKTVCEHVYACFWAILSDEELQGEYVALFAKYLRVVKSSGVEPPHKVTKEDMMEALKIPDVDRALPPGLVTVPVRLRPVACKIPVQCEEETAFTFEDWMRSIIERVNQEMHFRFSGTPEPLIFHAPQKFFNCLENRMNKASGQKRMPDNVTVFIRKDAIPLGSFTKFTYNFHNLDQVRRIFSTPSIQIHHARSFVADGKDGYRLVENETVLSDVERQNLLQTRLKLGIPAVPGEEPTPFCIEWIPNLLPLAKIGELRIKFQFCHFVGSSRQKPKFVQGVSKVLIPRARRTNPTSSQKIGSTS